MSLNAFQMCVISLLRSLSTSPFLLFLTHYHPAPCYENGIAPEIQFEVMCYPCPSTPFFKLEEYKTVFLVISGLIAIVLFLFGWLLQYYTQSSYLARC